MPTGSAKRAPRRRIRRSPWRAAAEVTARQHGVISAKQLNAAGLSRHQVAYATFVGRLFPVLLGVHALGHGKVSDKGRWRAGTLAVGDAALSYPSALFRWELRGDKAPAITHVTAPRRARAQPGLAVCRRTLPADERTIYDGIPVTSVARTLLDLAAAEGRRPLERALREAHFSRPADPAGKLLALLARYPGARGSVAARGVLEARLFAKRTRSDFEVIFLELLDDAGIELPRTNYAVELAGQRLELDCAWPERRFGIELDSRAAHDTPEQFEVDRERDAILLADGWRIYRLTWRRLHAKPGEVLAEVRMLLEGGHRDDATRGAPRREDASHGGARRGA